ncbi:Amino_acid transporter family protein [Hexamita inflata]|uniref:Amino acid transporter family protein n=1 Tax=Hexamita inflata TaxID=28002 RepID=A0AA86PYV4_9EUKA|nr:Amino acid transporter family protein [Hexamita inflata]CAI9948869.1 Amino acid transporter family protein [Hexamita inflata]
MSDWKQILTTSSTLISQMMGASLLSIAFIVNKLGWVIALSLHVFTILCDVFMYKYYIDIVHYTQAGTYRQLTEKALSKKLSFVLDISIWVSSFGVVTNYIIISSTAVINFIQNVFNYTANKYVVKAVISLGIIFPLCLLKSLKQLSKIATVASTAIFVTAFTVIAYYFMHLNTKTLCIKPDNTPISYHLNAFPNASVFTSILYFLMYIPALQNNFTCHTIIPNIFKELKGSSLQKRRIIQISLFIAISVALFLYVSVGFMGAAMFGTNLKDNLLKSFAPCKWIWIDICSLLFATVVIVVYPLIVYPIKMSITNMCGQDPTSKKGYQIQLMVTIVFVVLSMGLAMLLEAIVAIFGLFQSIAGIIFYFVTPICLIVQYPKIKANSSNHDESSLIEVAAADKGSDEEVSNQRKIAGVIGIATFSIICAVGVWMNGIDAVNAFK